MKTKKIKLSLELTQSQATDLAQYLKRVQFEDLRRRLMNDDETYNTIDSLANIRDALANAGFNPR